MRPIRPPEKSKEDILLFFKLYNPEKEELRYISSQGSTSFFDTKDSDTDIILLYSFVGRLFVKALGKPSDILTKLNEMAGFSPNEEIELYEVSAIFSYVQLCFISLAMYAFLYSFRCGTLYGS